MNSVYVFYRKVGANYEVRVENYAAEPALVDFEVWSSLLREYGRNINGQTSLSGSIVMNAEDLVGIV